MNKRHDEDIDELFERFYAAHFPRVKNFAMMLTKSPHDAEDIAQSIFMKLWMRPDLWTDDASMDAYLHVVTRNEIFALFKHRRVEQDYEDKARASGLMEELCDDPAASPLRDIYYRETLLLIKMALNRLPERRREVFEMSRFDGLSNKEIAEKLQMPVRTVEDHIYKTLLELRKLLMFVIILRIFP